MPPGGVTAEMRFLISPAKKMGEEDFLPPEGQPLFLDRAGRLLETLRAMPYPELRKLLACNDTIAQLNYQRYQALDLTRAFTPALLAYEGIQYQYMAPGLFTQPQFDYIKERLRILSGFYGVLRPLDPVVPYRLEMQAKLALDGCKNLYQFWGDALAKALEGETDLLINLASQEYAKAVRPHLGRGTRFLTCVFAQKVGDKLVEKGVYVKMARGEMVRFLAERQAKSPEEMRGFDRLGYRFSPEESGEDAYVFLQEKRP